MNIDFKIKIPLINKEDPLDKSSLTVTSHLMLTPFYALETDVISSFTSIEEKDIPWVRKLIFNASLTVYRLTTGIDKKCIINEEDLGLLRRDFVICMVTNEVAKQLHKDNVASISRSKTLGDFSVSTSKKNDNEVLLRILNDSSDCIEEMKKIIDDILLSSILPKTFVKGRYNPKTKHSERLWWNNSLDFNITDGYASNKYKNESDGIRYKAGRLNIKGS